MIILGNIFQIYSGAGPTTIKNKDQLHWGQQYKIVSLYHRYSFCRLHSLSWNILSFYLVVHSLILLKSFFFFFNIVYCSIVSGNPVKNSPSVTLIEIYRWMSRAMLTLKVALKLKKCGHPALEARSSAFLPVDLYIFIWWGQNKKHCYNNQCLFICHIADCLFTDLVSKK